MTSRFLLALALLSPLALADDKSDADARNAEKYGTPFEPKKAAETMTVPEGVTVQVVASEPDVVQPIACAFDDRGRLWVVECRSYPKWIRDGSAGNDRVLIFEDADGDGSYEKRTVFLEGGRNLTSIALGFGGVYLLSLPELVFIPDADGDGVPDGESVVLLDGWSLDAKHNVANGLTWGPDGWLYGCHGILATSRVGKPGAAAEQRTPLNCGVWRFHPVWKAFEVVCWGTTNPWGLDYDATGEMFITNCVIKHLFHVLPNAHYVRMYGEDLNPNVYGLIESCADHLHWGGGAWQSSRNDTKAHDEAGGGHAHSGCVLYLGDRFADLNGHLLTVNIHGRRLNRNRFEPHKSGVIAKAMPDFAKSADPWFRGVEVKSAPDGSLIVLDWSDAGECHDYDHCDKETGRIYRLTTGPEPKRTTPNLGELSDRDLIGMQRGDDEWLARRARLVLQERAAAEQLDKRTPLALWGGLVGSEETHVRLRHLWALHVTDALTAQQQSILINDEDEVVRAWSVRLLAEKPEHYEHVWWRLIKRVPSETSPRVRRELASSLRRLPLSETFELANLLAAFEEDADDPNIPLLIWYGVEPAIRDDRSGAIDFIKASRIPLLREYTARLLTSGE